MEQHGQQLPMILPKTCIGIRTKIDADAKPMIGKGYSKLSHELLKFYGQKMTFPEARKTCNNENSEIAIVIEPCQYQALLKVIGKVFIKHLGF